MNELMPSNKPKIYLSSILANYNMESMEAFVKQSIKEGRDSIEDFDELQQILSELDTEEKTLYLKYSTHSNT